MGFEFGCTVQSHIKKMCTIMTHDEKINYMRIAAGMASFNLTNAHLDLLVSLYELVIKTEGEGTISDAVEIEMAVEQRALEAEKIALIKRKQALLDEVSEKVEN